MGLLTDWRPQRRRFRRWLLLGLSMALLVGLPPTLAIADSSVLEPAAANPVRPEAVGNKVDGFPVTLDGEPLFYVKQGVDGVTTAEERAGIITQRLGAIAADSNRAPTRFALSPTLPRVWCWLVTPCYSPCARMMWWLTGYPIQSWPPMRSSGFGRG